MGEPGRQAGWRAWAVRALLVGVAAGGPGCARVHDRPDPAEPEKTPRQPLGEDPWSTPFAPATSALDGWRDPAPQPPEASDPIFAEGTVHRIDIELDGGARSALASDPRTDVPATLRLGEESWLVGLRLKGSFSFRTLAEKASFKIDFEQFQEGQRFYGMRRITLNNMVQDRSMIREHEAYWMYARLGVPSPRHGYAEVWVDGTPYGVYGLLETIDGTWAEREFPNDAEGSIYEGGYGVDLEGDDATFFDLQRQGELAEPYTDLAALIEELEATPPEDYLAWLERHFDAEALFRMWAMDLVLGHRDGYVKRKNNFLLYHGLQGDRWWMVPWGQDQTFRDAGMDVTGGYTGELVKRCGEVPDCLARLDATITYVLGVWEGWDLYGHAAATGALIESACERDPRKELACGYENELEMIQARPGEVRAQHRE